MKTIIALDVGTSSTRGLAYGDNGTLLFTAAREYHPEYPKPLHVEQDPREWASAAEQVLGEAAAFLKKEGLDAEGVVVTSQRASVIPLDEDGNPLRPAITWQDKRTIGECRNLIDRYGLEYLYRKTGLRANPIFVLPKLLWLKANEPEGFGRARRFVGVQDFVVFQLTGEYKTDWTQASRTLLLDLANFRWDRELLAIAGISEDRLCELVPPGSVAGGLTAGAAARTGLPAGLPVVIAGGDQQNAALALGVIRPGVAEANTGTGSFVLSYSDKPAFDPECRVLCQASAIAGKWMLEAGIFNTGAIYRWFKERFCPDLREDRQAYELMNREAKVSPPGANGVVLLPHFQGSLAPNWNPAAKGIFFNLSLGTSRGDMLRAILEGIALEIRDNLALIQELSGPITSVSVAGGMVRSDFFCQIQASAYDKRIIRYESCEASSLGACMVAAPALGVHESLEKAFAAMVCKSLDAVLPVAEDAEFYARLAERRRHLYQALHESGTYEKFL